MKPFTHWKLYLATKANRQKVMVDRFQASQSKGKGLPYPLDQKTERPQRDLKTNPLTYDSSFNPSL